jgi:hypothetical protein
MSLFSALRLYILQRRQTLALESLARDFREYVARTLPRESSPLPRPHHLSEIGELNIAEAEKEWRAARGLSEDEGN